MAVILSNAFISDGTMPPYDAIDPTQPAVDATLLRSRLSEDSNLACSRARASTIAVLYNLDATTTLV